MQETIPLGFHQCPLIAGKDEQIPDLTLLLAGSIVTVIYAKQSNLGAGHYLSAVGSGQFFFLGGGVMKKILPQKWGSQFHL